MAALDFYGLFDYTAGDGADYEYTATEFCQILKPILGDGVVHGLDNELAVTATGLSVSVATGMAFIQGRVGQAKTAKALTVDAAATARIDRIILRVNVPTRKVTLEVLKGSSGTTPPALTQTASIWELSLARILIPAGSTATVVTDERRMLYSSTEVMETMEQIMSGAAYVRAVYS